MNIKTATNLAIKATFLADLCECTADEAIRFLAAKHTLDGADLITLSAITGISTATLKRLAKAEPGFWVTSI